METNNMWFTEAAFVDFEKMEVRFSDGKSESFPGANVYKLLLYFAENKTKTLFSAKELIQCIWGDGDAAHGYSNTNLNTEIKKLRRLLRCEDRKCEDGLLFYDAGIKMYRFHPSDKQSESPKSGVKENTNLSEKAMLRKMELELAVQIGESLQEAELKEAKLPGAELQRANLKRADLQGANLQGANLELAYLQEANLQGARMQRVDLDGANLFRAKLQGANLQGAKLENAHLSFANLQEAELEQANLHGAVLVRANLQGANLQGANLQCAKLEDAKLQCAELFRADLFSANMQRAKLQGANLGGANLQWVKLQGAEYCTHPDAFTAFPDGFNPKEHDMIEVDINGDPVE